MWFQRNLLSSHLISSHLLLFHPLFSPVSEIIVVVIVTTMLLFLDLTLLGTETIMFLQEWRS